MLLRDRLAHRRVRHLKQRRRAGDRDVLGHVGEAERDRRLANLAVAQREVLDLDGLEPGQLDADLIGGGRKIRNREAAVGVGDGGPLRVGPDVGDGDGRARQRAACGIDDLADNSRGCRLLRERSRRCAEHCRKRQASQPPDHSFLLQSLRGHGRNRGGCKTTTTGGQRLSRVRVWFCTVKQRRQAERHG